MQILTARPGIANTKQAFAFDIPIFETFRSQLEYMTLSTGFHTLLFTSMASSSDPKSGKEAHHRLLKHGTCHVTQSHCYLPTGLSLKNIFCVLLAEGTDQKVETNKKQGELPVFYLLLNIRQILTDNREPVTLCNTANRLEKQYQSNSIPLRTN